MKTDTVKEQRKKYNTKKKIEQNNKNIQKVIEYYTKYEGKIESHTWLWYDIKKTLNIDMPHSTFSTKLHKEGYYVKNGKLVYQPPENPTHTFAELIFKHYYEDYLALRLKKPSYASLVVKILNEEFKKQKLGYHCVHINGIVLCFFNKKRIISTDEKKNTQPPTSSEVVEKIISILKNHKYDESLY